MVLPVGNFGTAAGLFLIGFGCAPIYPCLIHSTPIRFGETQSQAIIGVEMASAYVGSTFMPPLFGIIAENLSISFLPVYSAILLVLMFCMHEKLCRKA
jgi:fucose permease